MTDVASLRQRDKEFSIEEKLLCCVWVHDRNINGKSYDDIQRDFEFRFNKKPPKQDLLIVWERNAFITGSVNIDDNYHMLVSNGSSGALARSKSSPVNLIKTHGNTRNSQKSYSNSNSSHSSPNSYQYQRPTAAGTGSLSQQPAIRRPRPMLRSMGDHQSPPPNFPKNFNPFLYKTELCRQFSEAGHCDYGNNCLFAHGKHELKPMPHRTKVCTSWTNGYCQYGNNCLFLHPDRNSREVRRHSPSIAMRSHDYHYPRASKMARMGP